MRKENLARKKMTSSLSLLDLVNHLHKLESSVSNILIEAAVKLSQLTDLNLFIIVETQDGRKFAGTQDLCNAYVNSSLQPIGNDVRINVDGNDAVVEEPVTMILPPGVGNRTDNRPLNEASVGGVAHLSPVTDIPSTSAPLLTTFSISSLSAADRKRRSHENNHHHTRNLSSSHSQSKVQKLDDLSELNGNVGTVKQEVECQVVSDDENETIYDVRAFDGFASRSEMNSESALTISDSFSALDGAMVPAVASMDCIVGLEDWRQGGNKMFVSPYHPPIVLSDTLCHKMRGLQSINSRNLFDKNASEYRLFASTVYDFGKHIFHYAPPQKDIKDVTVLAFITECVEVFLKQHPYLVECESQECKVNRLSITGFIRDRVKGGFKRAGCSLSVAQDYSLMM